MKGLIIMSTINTIKLVEVETWENNWYWTIPNEIALKWNTVLNEEEFVLPDGFVVCEAGDRNRYIYKSDDLDYPVNLETDYSKNKDGDVYIILNDYPKYPTRIKLERKVG